MHMCFHAYNLLSNYTQVTLKCNATKDLTGTLKCTTTETSQHYVPLESSASHARHYSPFHLHIPRLVFFRIKNLINHRGSSILCCHNKACSHKVYIYQPEATAYRLHHSINSSCGYFLDCDTSHRRPSGHYYHLHPHPRHTGHVMAPI